MMKKTLLLAIAAIAVMATGCRTSEANYRAAYDKAVEGRKEATPLDSTIYGKVRREMRSTALIVGGDTISMRVLPVNATPDENDKVSVPAGAYGVVAGQFKTLFNARSLCRRLQDAGYAEASVVNTAEPYYYVVASWHPDGASAAEAIKTLAKQAPVAMRDPLPFVLKNTNKAR